MYRYISRESCSQFDSLPLTSLTIFFCAEGDEERLRGSEEGVSAALEQPPLERRDTPALPPRRAVKHPAAHPRARALRLRAKLDQMLETDDELVTALAQRAAEPTVDDVAELDRAAPTERTGGIGSTEVDGVATDRDDKMPPPERTGSIGSTEAGGAATDREDHKPEARALQQFATQSPASRGVAEPEEAAAAEGEANGEAFIEAEFDVDAEPDAEAAGAVEEEAQARVEEAEAVVEDVEAEPGAEAAAEAEAEADAEAEAQADAERDDEETLAEIEAATNHEYEESMRANK